MADPFAYHIYLRQSGFVVRGVGKWHRMEVEGRATMPLILHLWGFQGDPGALGSLSEETMGLRRRFSTIQVDLGRPNGTK